MSLDKKKQTRTIKLESVEGENRSVAKSWFLGIGVDHYPNFSNLRNAQKDITDVLSLL